jgi:hypothetical protein
MRVKYIFRFNRNMSIDYYEAASLLFGEEPFSTGEFKSRTASPRAAKTLSELKSRGLAERLGRGRYRLLSPSSRPDRRAKEWDRAKDLLLGSGLPMAWSGPSAVEIWTRGRYYVSPSFFVRMWHIDVPKESVRTWLGFLRDHHLSTDSRRRLGNKVVLHPVSRLRKVILHGEPVVPRGVVLNLIRSHRAIYANADRLVVHGPRPT